MSSTGQGATSAVTAVRLKHRCENLCASSTGVNRCVRHVQGTHRAHKIRSFVKSTDRVVIAPPSRDRQICEDASRSRRTMCLSARGAPAVSSILFGPWRNCKTASRRRSRNCAVVSCPLPHPRQTICFSKASTERRVAAAVNRYHLVNNTTLFGFETAASYCSAFIQCVMNCGSGFHAPETSARPSSTLRSLIGQEED